MSDPKTPNGHYYRKIIYFEDVFHDRHLTIGVLLARNSDIYIGISICCPQDEEKKELGQQIARGRAESALDRTADHNKAKRVISSAGCRSVDKVLMEDTFFLKQIGRSFFYDFKSNPQKYIAGYEA